MKDPDMLSQVVYAFADVAVKNARSLAKKAEVVIMRAVCCCW